MYLSSPSHRRTTFVLALALSITALVPTARSATVGRAFVTVNSSPNGVSDFGSGLHTLGSPGAGLVQFDYVTPLGAGPLSVTGTILGTLYFDKLCLNALLFPVPCNGHAHADMTFLDGNHTVLATRTADVNNAPGNNANDAANQTPINQVVTNSGIQFIRITCDGVSKEVAAPNGVNNTDVFVSAGSAFFGGTQGFGDAPLVLGDGAIVGVTRRGATMNGGVIGELYWNNGNAGNAMLLVRFERRDGVLLDQQQFLLRATGGDPNDLHNKLPVDLPNFFTNPQLWQIHFIVGNAFINSRGQASFAGATAEQTIQFIPGSTGEAALSPSASTVAVDQQLDLRFQWTVHEGEVWRDLHGLDLRLRDGHTTALWAHWDEAANTFRLCRRGHGNEDEDADDVRDGNRRNLADEITCGPEFPVGSNAVLETKLARLDLAGTTVTGSGPTCPSVTLNLALRFKHPAAGRTFDVELAASDDSGVEDGFVSHGIVTVRPHARDTHGGKGHEAASAEEERAAPGVPVSLSASAVPNPTGGSTTVTYEIPASLQGARVDVDIWDVSGRRVCSLFSGVRPAGRYSAVWNLRNGLGRPMAGGVFLYRVRAGGQQVIRKLVVTSR